jgi:hypothetical protein
LFRDLLAAGLESDATSVTILMRAYQSLGSIQLALDTEAAATQAGKTNVVSQNLLVDILVSTGELTKAEKVVSDLADAAQSHSGARAQALLPAFDALARGYGRAKRCRDAVAVLRKFNSLGGLPDEGFFEGVLKTCLYCGDVRPPKRISCNRACTSTGTMQQIAAATVEAHDNKADECSHCVGSVCPAGCSCYGAERLGYRHSTVLRHGGPDVRSGLARASAVRGQNSGSGALQVLAGHAE